MDLPISQLLLLGVLGGLNGKPRAASPPPPTVLLLDTFTGTDGTLLAAHTMNVGSGWTPLLADCSILSNSAVSLVADGGDYANAGVAVGNCSLAVTTPVAGVCDAGLALNVNPGGTGYFFQPYTDSGSVYSGSGFYLFGLTAEQLAFSASALTANHTYLLTCNVNGDTITCKVDGVQVFQYIAANRPQKSLTNFGIAIFTGADDAGSSLDNFRMTT